MWSALAYLEAVRDRVGGPGDQLGQRDACIGSWQLGGVERHWAVRLMMMRMMVGWAGQGWMNHDGGWAGRGWMNHDGGWAGQGWMNHDGGAGRDWT